MPCLTVSRPWLALFLHPYCELLVSPLSFLFCLFPFFPFLPLQLALSLSLSQPLPLSLSLTLSLSLSLSLGPPMFKCRSGRWKHATKEKKGGEGGRETGNVRATASLTSQVGCGSRPFPQAFARATRIRSQNVLVAMATAAPQGVRRKSKRKLTWRMPRCYLTGHRCGPQCYLRVFIHRVHNMHAR